MERVPNFIKQQICFFEDETTALRTDFFFFKVSDGDNSFAYYMYYAYGVKSAILS